ncbi:MAG: nucleotidyltransferase domain-containing protein [archaeon]
MKPITPKKYREIYVSSSLQKTLEFFCKYPDKEVSLNDLAREVSVSKGNLSGIVKYLLVAGYVRVEKLSSIWRICANRESFNFLKAKLVYNLNFIYQSGLVEFLKDKYASPRSIILFGSFRRGEDTTGSDIDIAIERPGTGGHKITCLEELSAFEKISGKAIQIHLFDRNAIDRNLFASIANGIVLSGFLEAESSGKEENSRA